MLLVEKPYSETTEIIDAIERHLPRLLQDLLDDEWQRLRPTEVDRPNVLEAMASQSGSSADSLERFSLATRVATFFNLHEVDMENDLLNDIRFEAWVNVIQTRLTRPFHSITFQTSGSTGQPKLVSHTLENLWQEANHWVEKLKPRCVQFNIPSHHLYGFIHTVLVPGLAKASIIDARDYSARQIQANLSDPIVFVTIPDWLRMFIKVQPPVLEPVSDIITSAAPCETLLSDQVQGQYAKRHIHIYGSTETAGVGFREGKQAHYTLLPYFKKSDFTFQRVTLANERQAVELQDAIHWRNDGTFDIGVRLDNQVKIQGINVSLGALAQRAKACPAIEDVKIKTFEGTTGIRLAYFVVAPQKNKATEEHIRGHFQQHFRPHERPAQLHIETQFQRNALGKIMF